MTYTLAATPVTESRHMLSNVEVCWAQAGGHSHSGAVLQELATGTRQGGKLVTQNHHCSQGTCSQTTTLKPPSQEWDRPPSASLLKRTKAWWLLTNQGPGRALTGSVRVLSFSKNCTTQYASWKGWGRERQQVTPARKRPSRTTTKHHPGGNGCMWLKCCPRPPWLPPTMLWEVLQGSTFGADEQWIILSSSICDRFHSYAQAQEP